MNIKNDCPIRKNCGACQLQNMEYEEQLSYKMSRAIAKLGKFCKVSEIIEMEEPFHYRNKAQVMFGSRSGRVVTGIYKSSTGGMAVMNSCLLDDIKADKIIASTKKLVSDMRITAYNPKTDRGILRHMMVRVAHGTGEIMVVIVTSGPDLPKRRDFVTELCKKHPEITTIVQCVNDTETPLWLGTREFVLHGTGYIEDVLQGCKFRLSAKSFYQINTVQTERLYNKIRDFAKPQKTDVILDAYCGIGTIGLSMAKDVELVVGVESNESSIEDANVNAKINGIKNAKFIKSDAGRYMQMAANEGAKINTMIIDPPRAGCDRKVIASIIKLKPEKLIYVSCNIETQARDLAALTKNGYKVFRIQPIDMFPHTRHVETVCLLSKLKSDHHIEVDLNMDELDLTSAESKATYDEIKAYVLEHNGLKVSSLYIAQVKEKLGIKERENYNHAKSEDAKTPQCPPEKEEAIRGALEHFGMIG